MADGLEDPELREQFTALVKEQGITRVPKVVSITASKFDPDEGTGQVLVFVTQLVTWGEDNTAVARRGYSFDMQRVDDTWKIGLMTELFEGIGSAPAQGAEGSTPDGLAPAVPGSAGN